MENNNDQLVYTQDHTDAIKNSIGGNQLFALLSMSSNHPDVLASGVDYMHTGGLHLEGLPEVIVTGNYPEDLIGSLVKHLLVTWTAKKDNTEFEVEIPLSSKVEPGQVVMARVVEITDQNKERYGRIINHVWPDVTFRMMQILLPDDSGLLPGQEGFDDSGSLQPNLSLPDPTPAVPAEEKFVDGEQAAPADEFEPLRLHIEEHKCAIYHDKAYDTPVAFTVGLSKNNLPEIMIAGNFSKQFVGETLAIVAQNFLASPPDVSSLKVPMEVTGEDGEKKQVTGQLLRVSNVNRSVVMDRVVLGLWPNHQYEVFQLMIPDNNGHLPGQFAYWDADNTKQMDFSDTTDLDELLKGMTQANPD